MKKKEIIEQLEGLADYTSDTMEIDYIADDIWAQDTEVLEIAIVAIQMLHDIFENLGGQCLDGEMIAILSQMGYEPEDFEGLDICTAEEAKQCIEDYQN